MRGKSKNQKLSEKERSQRRRQKIMLNPELQEVIMRNNRLRQKERRDRLKDDPDFKRKNAERQKKYRDRQKSKADITLNLKASENEVDPLADVSVNVNKKTPAFYKRLKKVRSSLPKDLEKQVEVINHLYFEFHSEAKPKSKRVHPISKTCEMIKEFYCRDDVSQELPGKRDIPITRDKDGNKKKIKRRVMLMTYAEAHSRFSQLFPEEEEVSFSKFYRLKPQQVSAIPISKHVDKDN